MSSFRRWRRWFPRPGHPSRRLARVSVIDAPREEPSREDEEEALVGGPAGDPASIIPTFCPFCVLEQNQAAAMFGDGRRYVGRGRPVICEAHELVTLRHLAPPRPWACPTTQDGHRRPEEPPKGEEEHEDA